MEKFSGEVCCNILSVYMVSCHLLLGKPWCSEQGAVPYLDHMNNYYYQYAVTCGRVTYNLLSMDMALFKTWRDDILQGKTNKEDAMKMQAIEAKFREHEEPKKREVDEAALFSMLVPSSAQELNPAAEFFENVPHHAFLDLLETEDGFS
jgi:hypothetical protein